MRAAIATLETAGTASHPLRDRWEQWNRPLSVGRLSFNLSDLLSRAAVGFLFLLLSLNLLADFTRTHRVTGLLLLVSEALVVILTVVRRRATIVDRSMAAATVSAISLVGPSFLRTGNAAELVPDLATAALAIAGLSIIIAGKLTLGRSFGIVPANRGVVATGPYLFVRHPIYAGYLITHVAFLVAHPGLLNIAIIAIADGALIIRALYEERTLLKDERYQEYCARVRWHIAPGVF